MYIIPYNIYIYMYIRLCIYLVRHTHTHTHINTVAVRCFFALVPLIAPSSEPAVGASGSWDLVAAVLGFRGFGGVLGGFWV